MVLAWKMSCSGWRFGGPKQARRFPLMTSLTFDILSSFLRELRAFTDLCLQQCRCRDVFGIARSLPDFGPCCQSGTGQS